MKANEVFERKKKRRETQESRVRGYDFLYVSPYETGGSFVVQHEAVGTITALLSIKFGSARGLRKLQLWTRRGPEGAG